MLILNIFERGVKMFKQDLFDPKSWLLMNDTVSETKCELDLAKDELVSLYIKGSHYILGLKEITMNKDTMLSVRYPSDYVHSPEITDDIHFSCWLTDHAFDWYSSIYTLDESYLAAINKETQLLKNYSKVILIRMVFYFALHLGIQSKI